MTTIRTASSQDVVDAMLRKRVADGRRGTGIGAQLAAGVFGSMAAAPSYIGPSPGAAAWQVMSQLVPYLIRAGTFPVSMLDVDFASRLPASPHTLARFIANSLTGMHDDVIILDDVVHITTHAVLTTIKDRVRQHIQGTLIAAWDASKAVHDQLPLLAEWRESHMHPDPFNSDARAKFVHALSMSALDIQNICLCAILSYLEAGKIEVTTDSRCSWFRVDNHYTEPMPTLLGAGACAFVYYRPYEETDADDKTISERVSRFGLRWTGTEDEVNIESREFCLAWLAEFLEAEKLPETILHPASADIDDVNNALDDAMDAMVIAAALSTVAYSLPSISQAVHNHEQRMLAGASGFMR